MALILVVDDELIVRNIVEMALKFEGHQVMVAPDANRATHLCAGHKFDLVTTDLNMPGMDGLALCRVIKTNKPDLPILMIASSPSDPLLADAFLRKPFSFNELIKAVNSLLKNSKKTT